MTEKKPLILIVDDVPLNISILSDALMDTYQIKVANSGKTALAIAQRQPQPDLILLDVMMPEIDGFEVCRRLKANPETKHIPVIFVTAKDSEFDETEGFNIGAVDYISKPFSIAVTKTRIKQHLQREQQAKKLIKEIQDRKQAQESLIVAGLVYNSTSEGMMLVNRENKIVAVNPAFVKLTGYSFDEVKGKNPKLLSSNLQDNAFYKAMWQDLNNTGIWTGEIWNQRKNGEVFAELLTINTIYDKQNNVHLRVALFSDITQRKKMDEIIWRQANYDALTNLPNRRLFQDRLEQALKKAKRDNSMLALFFVDLDHFKEINDTKGHDAGDLLLIEAAKRLRACVRETDTVARLGGDEFTIIFEELAREYSIERVAKSICESLAKPFFIRNEWLHISASVGITFFPDDGTELSQLLKNADQAMYFSKQQGRNRFSYFTPQIQKETVSRLYNVDDLRFALNEKQFELFFQPIIDIQTGQISKAEALIRWRHPERGLVFPSDFIYLAEESGLIIEMGNWVFKESANYAKNWSARFNHLIKICINVSPLQFSKNDTAADWIAYLTAENIPAKHIIIELTEDFLLHTSEKIIEQLNILRQAGIEFAIDDFGTGYTALSYLRKIEIDYLKIHQSFVQNLSKDSVDLILSQAIIVMAHQLNYEVIAEGIETNDQKNLLMDANCDKGQGFLFSKALSSENFEQLLTYGLDNPLGV